MGARGGKSGQYPEGKVVIDPEGNLDRRGGKSGHRNDHLRDYHQLGVITNKNYHSQQRRLPPSSPCEFRCRRREGRKSKSKLGWPDLRWADLHNPNDLFSVHSLLASLGLIHDDHDGLRIVAIAASMARRLASLNPHGYFAQIIREGFTKFGPADIDHAAAKLILRELYA